MATLVYLPGQYKHVQVSASVILNKLLKSLYLLNLTDAIWHVCAACIPYILVFFSMNPTVTQNSGHPLKIINDTPLNFLLIIKRDYRVLYMKSQYILCKKLGESEIHNHGDDLRAFWFMCILLDNLSS